eukprot:TRINITY_DN1600_c0_g1_i2.p1 TRINITY_DN1600_c0_g1~~TRINITY_DN1600_c0_g1_i2.p1  ORF type:complete len:908 (-),score=213.86 TRINITY_DN1600_c0_g1_i2:337-3060(-)
MDFSGRCSGDVGGRRGGSSPPAPILGAMAAASGHWSPSLSFVRAPSMVGAQAPRTSPRGGVADPTTSWLLDPAASTSSGTASPRGAPSVGAQQMPPRAPSSSSRPGGSGAEAASVPAAVSSSAMFSGAFDSNSELSPVSDTELGAVGIDALSPELDLPLVSSPGVRGGRSMAPIGTSSPPLSATHLHASWYTGVEQQHLSAGIEQQHLSAAVGGGVGAGRSPDPRFAGRMVGAAEVGIPDGRFASPRPDEPPGDVSAMGLGPDSFCLLGSSVFIGDGVLSVGTRPQSQGAFGAPHSAPPMGGFPGDAAGPGGDLCGELDLGRQLLGRPRMYAEPSPEALVPPDVSSFGSRSRSGARGPVQHLSPRPSPLRSCSFSACTDNAAPGVESAHPMRSVILKNLPPGVDDDELRAALSVYGPLRELGAQLRARGGRGSVTAAYYDVRHARQAVRDLDGVSWFDRKLVARFWCPAAGAGGGSGGAHHSRDGVDSLNLGTLVVFNMDASTTAEDVRALFSTYGDVKEIRETPTKRHHRFVEFFDVRDAQKALRLLNKAEINGKKIKVEVSRPGGRGVPSSPPASRGGIVGSSCGGGGGSSCGVGPPDAFGAGRLVGPDGGRHLGGGGHVERTMPSDRTPPFSSTSVVPDWEMSSLCLASETLSPPRRSPPLSPLSPPFSPSRPLGAAPGAGLDRVTHLTSCRRVPSTIMVSPSRGGGKANKFTLDLDRVASGEDQRTTLMLRNLPNKYTQPMLVDTLLENHKGAFDFIYLPVDFEQNANVGYAFINLVHPRLIIKFYADFHGHKWSKFNSSKVCEVAYARLQGKASLITHFQNSSLMNEQAEYRPVLFNAAGELEPFPVGPNVRTRRGPSVREARALRDGEATSPHRFHHGRGGHVSSHRETIDGHSSGASRVR